MSARSELLAIRREVDAAVNGRPSELCMVPTKVLMFLRRHCENGLREPALPLPPKAVTIPPTVIRLAVEADQWRWRDQVNSGGERQYIGVCCALDAEEVLPASVVVYSRLVGTNDADAEREWFVSRPGREPIALRDWWAK